MSDNLQLLLISSGIASFTAITMVFVGKLIGRFFNSVDHDREDVQRLTALEVAVTGLISKLDEHISTYKEASHKNNEIQQEQLNAQLRFDKINGKMKILEGDVAEHRVRIEKIEETDREQYKFIRKSTNID